MILIEGADGLGKTTLAKSLQSLLKCAYVHYGPLPEWWRLWDYVTRVVPFSVYDRYHWSALAYLDVLPQSWPATLEHCRDITKALRNRCNQNFTQILLYSSENTAFDSIDDKLLSRDKIVDVNKRYIELIPEFDLTYDISTTGYLYAPLILEDVNARLRKWRAPNSGCV